MCRAFVTHRPEGLNGSTLFCLDLFCLELFVFFEENTDHKDRENCRQEHSRQTREIVKMPAKEWEREMGNAVGQSRSDQEKPQHEVCDRISVKQAERGQKPQRAEYSHERNGEEVAVEQVEVKQP